MLQREACRKAFEGDQLKPTNDETKLLPSCCILRFLLPLTSRKQLVELARSETKLEHFRELSITFKIFQEL